MNSSITAPRSATFSANVVQLSSDAEKLVGQEGSGRSSLVTMALPRPE